MNLTVNLSPPKNHFVDREREIVLFNDDKLGVYSRSFTDNMGETGGQWSQKERNSRNEIWVSWKKFSNSD